MKRPWKKQEIAVRSSIYTIVVLLALPFIVIFFRLILGERPRAWLNVRLMNETVSICGLTHFAGEILLLAGTFAHD